MRWEDERYVRVYTRDTPEWVALGWEAQGLLMQLMRKCDRAGILELGKAGLRGLAVMLYMPQDVIERAMSVLLEDSCVALRGTTLVIRNFVEAQEAIQSNKLRKERYNERRRDQQRALDSEDGSQLGTPWNAEERDGTERNAVARGGTPSRTTPSRTQGISARTSDAGSEPPDSWDPDSVWEPDGDSCHGDGPRTARSAPVATPLAPPDAKRPAKAKPAAKPDLPVDELSPSEQAVHDALVSDPDLAPICQRPAQLARDLVKAGPGVDVVRDVRTAGAWLRANPKKAKKKGNAFLLNWVCRSQERGGTIQSNSWRGAPQGPPPGPPPRPITTQQAAGLMDHLRSLKPGQVVR